MRSVGPLDESYFAYHEEVDWCFRARAAGWRIYYQPFSRVWHHFSKSTDVRRPLSSRKWNRSRGEELPNPLPVAWSPVRTYLGARNSVRFVRAHGTVLQKLRFVLSTLYAIPLELLAVVLEREEELKLGLLTYRRALAWYCLEETGAPPEVLRGAADPPPGLASPCRCTRRALQVAAGGGPTRAAGRAHRPGRRLYPRPLGCRPGPAGPAGRAGPPAADGWPVTPARRTAAGL